MPRLGIALSANMQPLLLILLYPLRQDKKAIATLLTLTLPSLPIYQFFKYTQFNFGFNDHLFICDAASWNCITSNYGTATANSALSTTIRKTSKRNCKLNRLEYF